MDAVKYLKEVYRMCDSMEDCCDCPLEVFNITFPCKGTKVSAEYKDAEKCVAEVEKWSKEHPVKTRQSAILNVFPNTTLLKNGAIAICPEVVDKDRAFDCRRSCDECRKNYWLAEAE